MNQSGPQHPRTDLIVPEAVPGDRAEAAAHWPELADLPESHELWIARDPSDKSLRGAVAVDRYPMPFPLTGCRVLPLMHAQADATPVGQALIGHAADRVRALGRKALYAWDSVRQDDPQWNFWKSLGFAPNPKLTHYQVPLKTYLDILAPLYDRLTIHEHVPVGADVVPLDQAPLGEVIQLQADNIGGDAGQIETRLRGRGFYPFHPQFSRVAIVDGRVTGMLLTAIYRPERIVVESRVVAPHARGRWVNVALMHDAALAAFRADYRDVSFLAGARHTDTHNLALRAGPTMHKRDVMVRKVDFESATPLSDHPQT